MAWPAIEAYMKGVWAVAGPLVGVLIGAYIANRNQRRQWLIDRKREEYKELLSAMTDAFGELLQLQNTGALTIGEFNRIQVRVHNAIQNCIFTSDAVILKFDIFSVWSKASAILKEGGKSEFAELTGGLLEDLRQIALKDIRS